MSELDGLRWAMAEERFAGKDYRGAGWLLVDIVEGDPGNVSARLLLARSHFHAARLTKAYDQCVALLEQDPTEPYARLLMARTCERLGRRSRPGLTVGCSPSCPETTRPSASSRSGRSGSRAGAIDLRRSVGAVQREGRVGVETGAPLDQTLAVDDARVPHPEVAHHRPRRPVVHLGEGDDGQVRDERRRPLQGRPPDLGGVAATGEGVPHDPAQLEHRLAVQVDPAETASTDEGAVDRSWAIHLPTPSPAQRSAIPAAHASTVARVQGPVQYATSGSPYRRTRSSTSWVPTGVSTSRAVRTGSRGRAANAPIQPLLRCARASGQRSS